MKQEPSYPTLDVKSNKIVVILGSTATLAAAADVDYEYSVSNIFTEYDKITFLSLVSSMSNIYQRLALSL